jgi:hypothetical protein
MRAAGKVHSGVKTALAISLLISLIAPLASPAERAKTFDLKQALHSHWPLTLANYDVRQRGARRRQYPTASQLAALKTLREQVHGLEIRFNPVTGTPRHVFSLSERLTAPSSVDPVTIARHFLKTHRVLFRLENREIDDLEVVNNHRTKHTGVTHLIFRQLYDGLSGFQGEIKVNIDRHGRILSVNGDYFPGIAISLTPTFSATQAVQRAARALFPDVPMIPKVKSASVEPDQATIFDRGPFTQDMTAKLVVFPTQDGGRLAWRVRLHLMDRLAWYDTLVDAITGELLFIHNLYRFDRPQGFVFDVHPDWGPPVLKSFVGDPMASPETWVAALPNIGTRGNNVMTLPLARNPEQHFNFPFNNLYNTQGGNTFDLDQRTLQFTPNALGGYDVEILPLSFETNLGENITNQVPDEDIVFGTPGVVELSLGFAFPFFGRSYTTAFVSAAGNVTFRQEISLSDGGWFDMILGGPRIAALWRHFDLSGLPQGSGLFVRRDGDRVVITWNKLPQIDRRERDSNTVQLRLLTNGVIEIAFNGVPLRNGLVGVSPGGNHFDLRPVDFSAQATWTGSPSGLAEKFPSVELGTATTNLFYHLNFMHDYLYRLGFDEASGNFQVNNFGRGGVGGDPVMAFAQEAGSNNAFFATAEDGQPALTGYFFFTSPPFRQADTDFDADVIYHEYVHGLTNRLVGSPLNVLALIAVQSDAMGEGWSDAYSLSITDDPIHGEYVTGNAETGIRRVNYARSPLMYDDFGNRFGPISALLSNLVTGGIALDKTFIPEVHDDGEIWATALWDLRTALGKERFEQLSTDALRFTPSNPSMLDGRDAILIADVASTEGASQRIIWTVFADRGMGVSARAESGNDTIIFQAFDTPFKPLSVEREVIYFDRMELGLNGWMVAGDGGNRRRALWHRSRRRGLSSVTWYYGREDTGTYDTGTRNFGALTSPVIHLPTIPPGSALVLEFDHFMRSGISGFFEGVDLSLLDPLLDNGHIRIIDTATGEIKQVAYVNNNTIDSFFFEHEEINISKFAGRSIRIQFYFDQFIDLSLLGILIPRGEGWYIENVRVSLRRSR